MRINAYVLAADPTWLATSVRAYYPHVERIVVSYDENGRGWTGAPVPVEACLEVLRRLDRERKLDFAPGSFSRAGDSVRGVVAETHQRRVALAHASAGADWVLQIDTDEVLPTWSSLQTVLQEADRRGLRAVEWPMRVLFRRLPDRSFLQVTTPDGEPHFEYPGSVAVRPGVELVECRRVDEPFLRPVVRGDASSLQVVRAPESLERRAELVALEEAIWHNSWGRPAGVVRTKIRSWGHANDLASWRYYYATWLPAPLTWRALRDFHPLYPPLWPRLARAPLPPFEIVGDRP